MQMVIVLLKLFGPIVLGPTCVGTLSVTVCDGILALPGITVRVLIRVLSWMIMWRRIIEFDLTR